MFSIFFNSTNQTNVKIHVKIVSLKFYQQIALKIFFAVSKHYKPATFYFIQVSQFKLREII